MGALAILLFASLHLAWRVDPSLRFEQHAPAFFVDAPFFARFAGVPGGWLSCGAAALAQANQHASLGAVVWFILLAALLLTARSVVRETTASDGWGPAGVVMAVAAALPGRFEGDPERIVLGLLVSFLSTLLWLRIPPRPRVARVLAAWAITGLLFYVAGAPCALLFGTSTLLAGLHSGSWGSAMLGAVGIVIVPVWRVMRPAYEPFGPSAQWGSQLTLVLSIATCVALPAWLALALVWRNRAGARARLASDRRLWLAGVAGAAGLIVATVDLPRQNLARLAACTARGEWAQAVRIAQNLGAPPPGARLDMVRALFHTGRLLEDLFALPLPPQPDLLPDLKTGIELARPEARTLFELGQINLAEHLAHEAFELEGSRPDLLRLLADINVLKDRPEAARIFLRRLRLAPFHRAEADAVLERLATDPTGANDPLLRRLRECLPRIDDADSRLPTDAVLALALAANPTNRMAVEYQLAHDLLNGRLEALALDVRRLDAVGANTLPRLCEEALAIPQAESSQPLDLHGRRISAATMERYRRFRERWQALAGRPDAARRELAGEFGRTFWYYYGVTARDPAAGAAATTGHAP